MNKLFKKLENALEVRREKGFTEINRLLQTKIIKLREHRKYKKWMLEKDALPDEKREKIRREIADFKYKPLISIVLPVYNVTEKWLRLCIESVLKQIYENWELCIADDCSPSPHIRKILEEYAAKDERIKVIFRAENGHISAASNSALKLATGEFAALLDHDDELAEDALFWVVKEINDFPASAMIYSDEDLIDERGRRYAPKFKPDFSRDLLYSLNLITHLSVYRTEILRRIGGFLVGAEGSQDYDLALRFTEEISAHQIRHIPRVLYHWRVIKGSVAYSLDEKPYAHERAREAIRAHLERTGKRARVSQAIINLHRVQYEIPENVPKVSLILSDSENFHKDSEKFSAETDYQNFEIIENSAEKAENLNRAAAESSGEILCFVNANLKPLAKDWLAELIGFALQNEIGAVGAKISETDKTILHGGLIIGTKEIVSAAHRGFASGADGNFLRLRLVNNFSAVSISCLTVRREVFEEVGGFDAENLPNRFFDADFCLKLREKNYRIVFTPYAELIKIDKQKRLNIEENPAAAEKEYFTKKWHEVMKCDPFYNPNLSKKVGSFSIEI